MVKGMKRKTVEVDVVAEKCNTIAQALTDAASLPADVIAMLVEVLPHSLGQPKDKRHCFQDRAVLAVDNVMQGVEANLKQKIDDARNKMQEARNQAAPSEAMVAAAEVKLREDSERFTKETKALAESALEFRAARTAVQEAKTAQEVGDQDLKIAAKKKDKLQVIIDELVYPLKDGTVPADDVENRCKSLLTSLKVLEFDAAMLMVLGSALAKVPSARGDFDILAIDQLDKYMAKHIDPINATLQAGEAGREQRANGVKLAQDALDQSLQAQKLRADAFEAAWKAKKDDEVALETAKRGLKDLAAQTRLCDKDVNQSEAEFDVFQEYARKTFEELKERITPEPLPVESENIPDAKMDVVEMPEIAAVVLPEAITA